MLKCGTFSISFLPFLPHCVMVYPSLLCVTPILKTPTTTTIPFVRSFVRSFVQYSARHCSSLRCPSAFVRVRLEVRPSRSNPTVTLLCATAAAAASAAALPKPDRISSLLWRSTKGRKRKPLNKAGCSAWSGSPPLPLSLLAAPVALAPRAARGAKVSLLIERSFVPSFFPAEFQTQFFPFTARSLSVLSRSDTR